MDSSVESAAEEILSGPRKAAPAALAASKRIANWRVLERTDAHEAEMVELPANFFAGANAQTGMRAFLRKQSPPRVVERRETAGRDWLLDFAPSLNQGHRDYTMKTWPSTL